MHSRVLGIPIPDDTALIPGQWIDLAAPHKWPGIVLLLEDERPDGRMRKMVDHLLPQHIPWHRGRDDAQATASVRVSLGRDKMAQQFAHLGFGDLIIIHQHPQAPIPCHGLVLFLPLDATDAIGLHRMRPGVGRPFISAGDALLGVPLPGQCGIVLRVRQTTGHAGAVLVGARHSHCRHTDLLDKGHQAGINDIGLGDGRQSCQ